MNENSLSNLQGISQLTSLSTLNASNNVITSLSGIENCVAIQELNVSGNKLTSIADTIYLYNLAKFNFSNNKITELPQWDKNCNLITVDGSYNDIKDLTPLSGLAKLNSVYMDYNANLQSVDCLSNCYLLIQVNVYGTKVKNVRALTDMSVIVKYDPT